MNKKNLFVDIKICGQKILFVDMFMKYYYSFVIFPII